MLWVNNKSVAFATNHTISISSELNELSNKDLGNGDWTSNSIKKFSWEVTTENMYSMQSYKKLFELMIQKQPVTAVFSVRKDEMISDPSTYFADWTWKYTNSTSEVEAPDMEYYYGKVLITSLDTQAPNDDNATFSCTLTGTGELSYFNNITPVGPIDPSVGPFVPNNVNEDPADENP